MIIVTGGAGFIGSALIWALNKENKSDITIVDEIDHDRKARNIAPLKYENLIGINDFHRQLSNGDWNKQRVEAILHMGACSDTTEMNWSYLLENNVAYTKDIIHWCKIHGVRCIYASSAATYGSGSHSFSDSHDLLDKLRPLNLYGKSKLMVDIWARDKGFLNQVVGLRYFNVFGPNEWHKNEMRSVINKKFQELQKTGKIELFMSEHPDYKDGEQKRDFIYIKDAVSATLHFLGNTVSNGLFNIGTGQAVSWNNVALAMFKSLKLEPKITYVPLPANLVKQYQYHTKAKISKLLASGYRQSFTEIDDAVDDYITRYLVPDLHLGE